MPLLPFRLQPYPDELLCSWLARLALHNGSGAWRPFLEATIHNRRLQHPMVGMVSYSDELENLLNALGTNYFTAMMELTTLPYWLAFEAPENSDNERSASNPIRQIRIQVKKPTTHGIHKAGSNRTAGLPDTARLCPACLDDDCRRYGEPYWHRIHQLPNVFVCASHGCILLSACPECNQTIVPLSSRLLDLPKLQCSCGYSLGRSLIQPPTIPAMYRQLVDVSVAALNNKCRKWSYADIRHYFERKMNERNGLNSYKKILCSAFELEQPPLGQPLRICINDRSVVTFRPYFSVARSSDFCALMVALNLDFKQISRELADRALPGPEQDRPPPKVVRQTLTLEVARQEMRQFMSEHRGCSPSRSKVLYWFLKLFDEQWLSKNFVVTTTIIPSISQDRKNLLEVLMQQQFSRNKLRERLINSPAGVRASLRDEVWLKNKLHELDVRKKEHRSARRIQDVASRVIVLHAVLQQTLAAQDWPVRINGVVLGQKAGLSSSQAQSAIRRDPGLRCAVETANESKTERQIIWAARQFQGEGHSISLKQILRRARVPTLVQNFDMARKARDGLSMT